MTTTGKRWRSTIRVRLTLLYAGAFFVAGAVLVGLMYLYLGQVLEHQPAEEVQHLSRELQDAVRDEFQRGRAETLNAMLVASLIALGVIGVIAAGFGWLLAGRVLEPLQQITATARRVADRSLHERIALDGPSDEIKDLADTFDAMLERLDRSFDSQRRFVANASHELRTPLTINRTILEVALDDSQAPESVRQLGATLLAVNQRHERLIDGLLTLAGAEERIPEPVDVDLADVARHIAAELGEAARDAGVEMRTDLAPAPVAGDPLLLERLTHNLVDNAIRYNLPEHGWIRVTTDVVGDVARLTVENSGPLIPLYDVPALFEPFRRLPTTERLAGSASPSSGPGAGLGLSIVRSVAIAHAGDVAAWPRDDGGLTVRVQLPVASGRSVSRDA